MTRKFSEFDSWGSWDLFGFVFLFPLMKKKQKIYLQKTPSGQTVLEGATRQIRRVHKTQIV